MKKFLAVIMAVVLMCGMLAACGGDNAQDLIDKANAVLEEEPYNITIKMNFECDNEDIDQIFSLMNLEIPTTVDGNNLAMDMSMDMMGYAIGVKMTVVDMVMYYDMNLMGESIKMKATLTEEQYQNFLAENNTEMTIQPKDFSELTEKTEDGKQYIACNGISDEALAELNDIVADSIDSIGATATVSNVVYNVTLSDGKYESVDMTCVYSMTVEDETFTLTLNMSAAYSYDNIAEITHPADAEAYEEIDFGELMG